MVSTGDSLPDARVWLVPGEPAVQLREALAGEGFALLCSYAFDWSGG